MPDWYMQKSIRYTKRDCPGSDYGHLRTDNECVIFDRTRGQLLAHISRDASGGYCPIVYVSLWQAIKLLRGSHVRVSSLLPLPRLAIMPGSSQQIECALVQIIAILELEPVV